MADFTGNPLFLVGGAIVSPDSGDTIGFNASNFVLDTSGNVTVTGNLVVQGTTITANAQDLIVGDDYLTINAGYTGISDVASGIINVVRVGNTTAIGGDPIADLESQATTGALAKITLSTNNNSDLSLNYNAGGLIQITGTDSNDGFYEIDTITIGTPDTITVKSSPANDFFSSDFTDETPTAGKVAMVDVTIFRNSPLSIGVPYEYGVMKSASSFDTGSITFTAFGAGGGASTPTFNEVFVEGVSESDRSGTSAKDYYSGAGITFPLSLGYINSDTGWGVGLKLDYGSSVSTKMDNYNADTSTYYLVAGENITAGDVVAIKNDGAGNAKLYVADSTTANGKAEVIGMAVEDASSGGFVHLICIQGQLAYSNTDTSAFNATTVGAPLYLGATGDVTSTAPTASGTSVVRVGYLVQKKDAGNSIETTLFFSPQFIGVNN